LMEILSLTTMEPEELSSGEPQSTGDRDTKATTEQRCPVPHNTNSTITQLTQPIYTFWISPWQRSA
jgi:hypothetical protein